jgi:TonB family protein
MRWMRSVVALPLALGCAEPRQVPDRPASPLPTASEPPTEKESRSSVWRLLPYREQVKRAVKAVWDPRAAIAKRDPDMTIHVTKGRRTRLEVTIDSSGWLKSVSVKESSGLKYLDQGAVEAFEKAQPFPPPPPGPLPGSDISFTFDFNLE